MSIFHIIPYEIIAEVLTFIHPMDLTTLHSFAISCRRASGALSSEIVCKILFTQALRMTSKALCFVPYPASRRQSRSEHPARTASATERQGDFDAAYGGYPYTTINCLGATWLWKWKHIVLWLTLRCVICVRKVALSTSDNRFAMNSTVPDSIICDDCVRSFLNRETARSQSSSSHVFSIANRGRVTRFVPRPLTVVTARDPLKILTALTQHIEHS